MPKRPDQRSYSPDDFYRAYASAMLNWQRVESALYRLYFSLFENGNLAQSGAAYYSLDSFGGKLRLVNATAVAVLMDAQLDTWEVLHQEIKSASSERNVLAHLPAVLDVNADKSLSLTLAPHCYIPLSMIKKRTRKYDAPECERLASCFDELAKKVDSFTAS